MAGRALALLIAVLLLGCDPGSEPELALVGVTIVDVESGALSPERTIEIDDGRIVGITAADAAGSTRGARVVDARGRYALAGLWDLHVHVLWDDQVAADFLPRFVAAGVTGVRDMGGSLEVLARVRAEPRADWPRIVAAGQVLDGPDPVDPSISQTAADAAGARAAVARLEAAGADFIKPYTLLPRAAFLAAAAEARARGLPIAGHVPADLTPLAAAEAGLASIEHLRDGLGGLCADSTAAECSALPERLAGLGVHVTPTLVVLEAKSVPGYQPLERAPDLESLPSAVADYWRALAATQRERDEEYFGERRRLLVERMATVARLRQAGVPILAGTDAGTALLLPGESLHRELAALVESGLTPREALYCATLGAARFLGLEDSGRLAEGLAADIVLLEENPLEDIAAVTGVAGVVRGGRWIELRRKQ